MKTIILAAGKAPRLLPLTKDTPQCLLRVKGKPILQHQIEAIRNAGIRDIDVICGYKADKVEAFCKKMGINTHLNPFYAVSGMAMTLWVARDMLKDGFILLYSDILFQPKTVSGLLAKKGDVCIAMKRDGLREEAEKVTERKGAITGISKVGGSGENGEFIGMVRFSKKGAKKAAEKLTEMAKSDLSGSVIGMIGNMIKDGSAVAAYDIGDARFVDIDFPEDLKKAEKLLS